MTRDDAVRELTDRMDARINGLALQALGRNERPRIPAEIGPAMAEIAMQWAAENGMPFDQ